MLRTIRSEVIILFQAEVLVGAKVHLLNDVK